jgi:ribosomal protein S18 acetylase RimI-like enzyme
MTLNDWEVFHQIDEEIFPDDSMLQEWFEKRLDREGFYAMDLDGQLVGMLNVTLFGNDVGYLNRIGVGKAHQRKGLGSRLMEKAIEWFNEREEVHRVHLFTQHDNHAAQGLYKKFGFEIVGTTWHYFVPHNTLSPRSLYSCQEIRQQEIDTVGDQYDENLPAVQLRRYVESDEYMVFTLKNSAGKIVGACRFTPSFPGCFPFELEHVDGFDDFLTGFLPYSLPEFDYTRVTFSDIPELAQLCESRNYRLHHRLFKMTLNLRKS